MEVLSSEVVHQAVVAVRLGDGERVQLVLTSADDAEKVVKEFREKCGTSAQGDWQGLEKTVSKMILEVSRAELSYYKDLHKSVAEEEQLPVLHRKKKPDLHVNVPDHHQEHEHEHEEEEEEKNELSEEDDDEDVEQTGGEKYSFGAKLQRETSTSSPLGVSLLKRKTERQHATKAHGKPHISLTTGDDNLHACPPPAPSSPFGVSLLKKKAERQRFNVHHKPDIVVEADADEDVEPEKGTLTSKEIENQKAYEKWVQAMSSPRRNNDPATFF